MKNLLILPIVLSLFSTSLFAAYSNEEASNFALGYSHRVVELQVKQFGIYQLCYSSLNVVATNLRSASLTFKDAGPQNYAQEYIKNADSVLRSLVIYNEKCVDKDGIANISREVSRFRQLQFGGS